MSYTTYLMSEHVSLPLTDVPRRVPDGPFIASIETVVPCSTMTAFPFGRPSPAAHYGMVHLVKAIGSAVRKTLEPTLSPTF